ncbi:MAG: ABC transporter substrate-binding protein [Pseudomonas sp.]
MSQKIKKSLSFAAAASVLLASMASAAPVPADLKPEAGALKIALMPWLGYGQLHVAKERDLYKANGLANVELVNFSEDKDLNAAFVSGQVDLAAVPTHQALQMVGAGLPVKIVMLMDTSEQADAILADASVKTLQDLKGKQIAFEEGTTSDILLRSALDKAGLAWSDITAIPMPAANAGAALIAERVSVAVTYEPYISTAKAQSDKVHVLFTGKDSPGLIGDVLVARDDVIESKPGQVLATVKAWGQAVDFYNADQNQGRKIISEAIGSTPEELKTGFDGVQFVSLAANKDQFKGSFVADALPVIEKAAQDAGLITHSIPAEQLIDSRFVEAAK